MPSAPPPRIWGIVNVTPDSFSDGGEAYPTQAAIARGLAHVAQGADVLDVGGESTRPGARPVAEDEECARVVPVIRGLRARGISVPISVDTRKASVAEAALEAGATIVNDVSAGRHDPPILAVAAAHGAGVVLMHMQGSPEWMQRAPAYEDVLAEVRDFLAERAEAALEAGVRPQGLWVDPGIGFGKLLEHNLALLAGLDRLVGDGRAVLLGASRKSFLGQLTGRDVTDRLAASLACAAHAYEAGAAAVRVHDVQPTRDLLQVLASIRAKRPVPTA